MVLNSGYWSDWSDWLTNQVNNQSLIPSNDLIHLCLTLKMTTAQVVETRATVNNNSPIQDYVYPDDHTQPTYKMTPWFKHFTVLHVITGFFIMFTLTSFDDVLHSCQTS